MSEDIETILTELEEIVGRFNGITTNKTFTQVKIGNRAVVLENGTKSTENAVGRLREVRKGAKIGILKVNGDFRVGLNGGREDKEATGGNEASANQN